MSLLTYEYYRKSTDHHLVQRIQHDADYAQVAEDYGEEERERLQEELSSVKRRFSHNKVKRKWVSPCFLSLQCDMLLLGPGVCLISGSPARQRLMLFFRCCCFFYLV